MKFVLKTISFPGKLRISCFFAIPFGLVPSLHKPLFPVRSARKQSITGSNYSGSFDWAPMIVYVFVHACGALRHELRVCVVSSRDYM